MTEQFKKLSDYQHARQRTEMYLGSREPHTQTVLTFDGKTVGLTEQTWVPSLYTGWRELIDNALDEMVAHGHGDCLRVSYDPETTVIEVEDNGRGLPLDEKPELGKGPAASILLGEARAGRNFDERGAVAGVNGLGAAIVNFTSEWFELDVWREGQYLHQRWEEGTYKKQDIHKTLGPTVVPDKNKRNGTRVRFKPSARVWPKMILPLDFIHSRMWDIAIANPKLKVWFNGVQLVVSDAVKDAVMSTLFIEPKASLIETKTKRVHSRFYVVPGHTEDEHIHSLVNNIPVFSGGPHIDEFRSLFYASLITRIDPLVKKAIGSKKTETLVTRQDVAQGLLIYNITFMDDPHFDSQTKTRLVSEIKPDIRQGFMESDVAGFVRRNPEWVARVVARCLARTQAANSRAVEKAQRALSKTKIASLKDATGKDRHNCILFIAEGESAISGMTSVRDAKIHGGIGLLGKIMNVFDKTPKQVLESKALTDIMNSIGLKIGEKAVPANLRYGKIYLTMDEDEDGKNITALVVNFLFKFWPELFRGEPVVYRFSTPLIILVKGNERRYIYTDVYDQFDPNEWKGWQIIRAKGLARLTKDDWKIAVEQPKLIPILDDGRMAETLDLIFNPDKADARKDWLST